MKNYRVLLLAPIALLSLAGCPNDGSKPQPPPTHTTEQPEYKIITGQKHDIGFGSYEYKLLLDDPQGDRWVTVSEKEYNNCMDSPSDTYPKCAGF